MDVDVSTSTSSILLDENDSDHTLLEIPSEEKDKIGSENLVLNEITFDKKGINFMHLNIHYLYPKMNDIKYLVDTYPDIDVMGLQETFLSDIFSDSEISLNNFQLFRRDRKSNGGGIVLYVKSTLPCELRSDLEIEDIEAIWLEMKLDKQKPLLIGYIYRPPSSLASWNDKIEETLEKIFIENKEMVIFGDFNYNFITTGSNNSKWNNIIDTFNLSQLITQPTRVTPTSSTTIDHIYSNQPQNISYTAVPILSISDHYPIIFTRRLNKNIKKGPVHTTINYRYLKNFNADNFLHDLSNQPWSLIDMFSDPDDALDTFNKLFLQTLDAHAPYKQKRVKHKNQADWFNGDIANAMHKRDLAKKKNNISDFKYWKSQVKTLTHTAKTEFFDQEINSNQKNPKKLWKNLKSLSGKTEKHQTNYIADENGTPITDPKLTADTFNAFFANVFKKAENITELSHEMKTVLKESLGSENAMQFNKFEIPYVQVSYVKQKLNSLDVTKATGMDGISAKFLKTASDVICEPICTMINLSVKSGKFPTQLKQTKVTPIYKKGSKSDKNNYRPISVLPLISKIYEKHVSDHLKSFLETNNLLFTTQSGFRAKHSCETALTNIIDNWINALNEGKLVGTLFLDLSKAFDLVNHKILIEKLPFYHISSQAINWITSYLSERSQKVNVSGVLSEPAEVVSGVPQGSVLGPLLFIIYINDLNLHVKRSKTDMFADDTSLTATGISLQEVIDNLQTDLDNVHTWCKQNAMVLNAQKTKSMNISTKSTKSENTKSPTLHIQDQEIELTDTEKLLGVHVDNNLKWKTHIQSTIKKCNAQLYLLLRIKQYLDLHSRKLFFNSYILPHLDYCCTIWGNCNNELLSDIIKFQKRAARIILDKSFDTPSNELFKELNWMTFDQRIKYKKSILVYKSINEPSFPMYMKNKFQTVNHRHNLNLRSVQNADLVIPKPKIEHFRKSFSYSGSKLWNDIPTHVRNSDTLWKFQTAYVRWLFTS